MLSSASSSSSIMNCICVSVSFFVYMISLVIEPEFTIFLYNFFASLSIYFYMIKFDLIFMRTDYHLALASLTWLLLHLKLLLLGWCCCCCCCCCLFSFRLYFVLCITRSRCNTIYLFILFHIYLYGNSMDCYHRSCNIMRHSFFRVVLVYFTSPCVHVKEESIRIMQPC
jgi:hypothetical protein